jgi:hypothetical protein
MTSEQLHAWLKQTGHDLIHGEEEEAHEAQQEGEKAEQDFDSDARRVLRSRVALAIVALSVFSAVAGWRASVFDERSSSSSAVFHQDLLVQQQLEAKHQATVAQDITQYGELEQHWFMATRPEQGGSAQTAERERVAAEQTVGDFGAETPTLNPDGTVSYDPALAYSSGVATDAQLGGLHPAAALRASNSESDQAVNMTLVAVLFIAGLVLFTLAQVTLGRRTRSEPAGTGRWTISHTFVLAGALVAASATVLFVLVMVH